MLKRIPFHPFAFASFPVLALLAYNIQETYPSVAVRPLVISLVGTALLFVLFRLLMRDRHKAALAVSLLVILFFLYGHLYNLLGITLGRHRLLAPLFGGLILLGVWLIWRKMSDRLPLTGVLNLVGAFLVIYPLVQIASYTLRATNEEDPPAPPASSLADPGAGAKPDIYYILLDTYTRADSLKANFNFDNSGFLDELRSLGFYVANCSRSNYRSTQASLASTLNLEYFPAQPAQGSGRNEPENAVEMIQHNLVKSQLRSLGYKIVAFETGYRWTEWSDADYFFQHSKYASETGTIDPFESILVNTTAVRFFADVAASVNRAAGRQILPDFDAGPYQAHVQRQLYILEELEDIPAIPGPKFVFVHGLITHSPLVFNPNGEISKTPCEYTQELRTKEERDCLKRNYTSAVMFTNTRMLRIIKTILDKSSIPPVIILQGDHGVQHISPYQILNAYYLPEKAKQRLYPTITPVNSFRLLLSDMFGANYPLLPDISYLKRNYIDIVPEESAACKAP